MACRFRKYLSHLAANFDARIRIAAAAVGTMSPFRPLRGKFAIALNLTFSRSASIPARLAQRHESSRIGVDCLIAPRWKDLGACVRKEEKDGPGSTVQR